MRLAYAMAVVVGLTAPASTGWAAPHDALMAPAEPPIAMPWKIGQSVTYELTDGPRTETISLRVIAEDGCGVWVEFRTGDDSHRACITRPPNPQLQVVVTRDKDGIKVVESPAKVGTLDALEARWNGRRGIPREDVTTPAGTFPAALKETIDGSPRWSHPAVPLGGMVRSTIGTLSVVLVDYTLTGGTSVITADQRVLAYYRAQERKQTFTQRLWVGIAFGDDVFGNIDAPQRTESLGFGGGYKLSPRIAIVADMTGTNAVPYLPKPELSERLAQIRAGVRYFPLSGSRGRWAALKRPIYLQVDAGYAQLVRGIPGMSASTVGRGVVGGARLGFSTSTVRDWRIAVEVHQHTALLNADEGVRITAGIHGIVELYFQ